MPTLPQLTPLEARVLGCLFEKERTVPDTYPMSLNALVAGCNQKTSRDPVMDASQSDVQAAVDSLRRSTLVLETSGGRVMRYSHNLPRVLQVSTEKAALLVTLMLRGPQTAAELRMNCERLYRFADVSSIEAYLEEMAVGDGDARVVRLARQPGAREHRWAHRLCGEPALPVAAAGADDPAVADPDHPGSAGAPRAGRPADGDADLLRRLAALEERVAGLDRTVRLLMDELGVRTPDAGA